MEGGGGGGVTRVHVFVVARWMEGGGGGGVAWYVRSSSRVLTYARGIMSAHSAYI